MTVWLGFNLSVLDSESRSVVNQSRYIFLFNDIDTIFPKPKEIIFLKEVHSAAVSVVRCHNSEGHIKLILIQT